MTKTSYPAYRFDELVSFKAKDPDQLSLDIKTGGAVWFLRLQDMESNTGALTHKNVVSSLAQVRGAFDFFSSECVLMSRLRPNLNKAQLNIIIPTIQFCQHHFIAYSLYLSNVRLS